MPEKEKTTRDEHGRFTKGNTIGIASRFFEGHEYSCKYREEICDEMIDWFISYDKYPTFDGYAGLVLHVAGNTLDNWREKHPQFDLAYKVCLSIQKARNQEGGMSGAYNSAFAKFLAVNTHGMTDKSENDSKMTVTITTNAEVDEESN